MRFFHDIVSPSDYVEYDSGWKYTPLLQGTQYDSEDDALSDLRSFAPVKLLIPIEHEGTTREYTFTFVASNLAVDRIEQIDGKKSLGAYYGVCGGIILVSLIVIATV